MVVHLEQLPTSNQENLVSIADGSQNTLDFLFANHCESASGSVMKSTATLHSTRQQRNRHRQSIVAHNEAKQTKKPTVVLLA